MKIQQTTKSFSATVVVVDVVAVVVAAVVAVVADVVAAVAVVVCYKELESSRLQLQQQL